MSMKFSALILLGVLWLHKIQDDRVTLDYATESLWAAEVLMCSVRRDLGIFTFPKLPARPLLLTGMCRKSECMLETQREKQPC